MAELGSGPTLSENFDFEIARNGDIEMTDGFSELEKDVAVNIAEEIEDFGLGFPITDGAKEDLRVELGNSLKEDDRIESIKRFRIEQDNFDKNKLNITIRAVTAEGPFEMVIPI